MRGGAIITPELARALSEISREVERQVGMLIDRRGDVKMVLIGDARSVFLPDLSTYRRGRDRLCGLRLVHTHLNGEPLNDDDLTDLALLRLDLVAAVGVREDGLPGKVFSAHLFPDNPAGKAWEILPPVGLHDLADDFPQMIAALEGEFGRRRRTARAGDQRERAILVHVSERTSDDAEESLAELRELARSAGIAVAHEVLQRRPVDPRYVLGKGRLKETLIKAMQSGAEILVFDSDLSPAQVNALAEYTDLKILDRTQVVLDIFAQRAQTREGKIQVELAQLRYLLPRLGMKQTASAFSRLTGGIGGRGPGETKLEIDRRRVQDRIAHLEREVTKLGQRRKLRRAVRTRRAVPIVAVVGYTNAGKSTLINNLTNSDVVAKDVMFATLNPVSRRLRFPREREVILTDTVGFIRDMPKELRAAFRTTFEELEEADLILLVLDASSRYVEDQMATVQSLLSEMELDGTPALCLLNKADVCPSELLQGLRRQFDAVPICALDRATFEPLLDALESGLWPLEHADAGS